MRKFLTHILIFATMLVLLLSLLDFMVTQGLRKSNAFIFDNLTKIFEGKIEADLLINGSSKALCQIDPLILDSVLSTDSYNFGMNGTGLELQNLVYQLYIDHNPKPKYIVQVVSFGTLRQTEKMHEYKRFAPYLNEEMVRKKAMEMKGFEWADFHIPFIRYAGFSIEIINGLANFIGIKLPTDKNDKVKGYSPHYSSWNDSFERFKKDYPNGRLIPIDEDLIAQLDMQIKTCKEQGINIVLVYPPTYYESHDYIQNREEIIHLYTKIARENDIPFLDFSSFHLYKSKAYFYDSQHLNKKGAEIFSRALARELKKHIIQ